MASISSSSSSPLSLAYVPFEQQRPELNQVILRHTNFCSDVVGLVSDYVVRNDSFGAKEWRKHFGVDVGPEPRFPEAFESFYNSPDPLDPTKKVFETHLPPILRPESIRKIGSEVEELFCVAVLNELTQNPSEGHPAKLELGCHDNYNLHCKTAADAASWLVLRKGGLNIGSDWDQQKQIIEQVNLRTGAGYEKEPSALDLATVLLVRYVFTKECYYPRWDGRTLGGPASAVLCKEAVPRPGGGFFKRVVLGDSYTDFENIGKIRWTYQDAYGKHSIPFLRKYE